MLKHMEEGEKVFEIAPAIQTEFEFTRQVAMNSTRHNWLNEIRGKWPGDEPIDDLIKELETR